MTVKYTLGADMTATDVYWRVDDRYPDLSSGVTFSVSVLKFGASPDFVKTTGLVGKNPFPSPADPATDAPLPNLTVEWQPFASGEELALLTPGRYILHYKATAGAENLETFDELIVSPPVANRGYCDVVDLALGALTIGKSENLYDYVNAAADEMDGHIGQLYELPLDLSNAAPYVEPLLRTINAKLATGRFLAARTTNEDKNVHAYGAQLCKEALDDVMRIACGDQQLIGVPKMKGSFKSTAPSITNRDDKSAVDSYEDFAHRYDGDEFWHPGKFFQTEVDDA